ncbi:MAG: PIN domain-containing protein [Acetobacteraceae bacterium]|nr:PIN domain-containing protein [Acetobacteraceae bacterium]
MSAFIDTNVLVYALTEDDQGDAARRVIPGGVISAQVMNELVDVLRRKARLEWPRIRAAVSDLLTQLDPPLPLTAAVHYAAMDLADAHRLSWWDALIVASALEAGCNTLWTEDMQDGRRFGRLTLRNPFA